MKKKRLIATQSRNVRWHIMKLAELDELRYLLPRKGWQQCQTGKRNPSLPETIHSPWPKVTQRKKLSNRKYQSSVDYPLLHWKSQLWKRLSLHRKFQPSKKYIIPNELVQTGKGNVQNRYPPNLLLKTTRFKPPMRNVTLLLHMLLLHWKSPPLPMRRNLTLPLNQNNLIIYSTSMLKTALPRKIYPIVWTFHQEKIVMGEIIRI